MHEPPGLRHLLDEHFFGWGGGRVLGDEVIEQSFEILAVFAGDDEAAASEAMLEEVGAGDSFAFGRAGPVGPDLF